MATADPNTNALPDPVAPTDEPHVPPSVSTADELVESELLVEDISIDGMCGVY
ncbi:MAG TPA: mycofactocin precursor MftA [Solirubrobacteraceae bacterium]|nr:mycofactocin precursor MftA [Solirubrobacteraceae bacterium]